MQIPVSETMVPVSEMPIPTKRVDRIRALKVDHSILIENESERAIMLGVAKRACPDRAFITRTMPDKTIRFFRMADPVKEGENIRQENDTIK